MSVERQRSHGAYSPVAARFSCAPQCQQKTTTAPSIGPLAPAVERPVCRQSSYDVGWGNFVVFRLAFPSREMWASANTMYKAASRDWRRNGTHT